MSGSNLRTAAEEMAGTALSDDEYRLGLQAARRKLEHINDMNGTHHGEPYPAILIAEAVQAQRLTRYLNAVYDLREQDRLERLT